MGELITSNLFPTSPPEIPSQYTRMIPGISATQAARPEGTHLGSKAPLVSRRLAHGKQDSRLHIHPHTLAKLFLPRPIADPLPLYQSVIADLIFLASVCYTGSQLFPQWSFHKLSIPLFSVLVTLFAFSEGVYQFTGRKLSERAITGLFRSVLFAALMVAIAEGRTVHLRAIPVMVVNALLILLLWREATRWAKGKQNTSLRRVLLVGAGPAARSIAKTLRNDPEHRSIVCGFVDDTALLSPEVLGRIADLDWLARGEFIDEVILTLPWQADAMREAAEVAFRNHLDIRAVLDLPAGPWVDTTVDSIGSIPVVTLHKENLPKSALWLKRTIDVVGACFFLAIAAPLMAIVAVLIRIESRGPIIYSAERIGVKGQRFRCYKFRSMVRDADLLKATLRSRNQRHGPTFKIDDDPRITRVGRFIRKYSIDELPQLWNVLIGDMSMVGPRPHPVDDVNRYELAQYRRLDVKPGLTGLWQITARHSPSFELNMHLDLTYIENWSLKLDLRILFKTLHVLFSPEGA